MVYELSMELVFHSDTRQRKWRFMGNSFAHPAKMVLPLQLWLIEHYTNPGDWILDPMAGSGTLLVACSLSRNVILCELEEKFVQMQKDNWQRVQEVGCELGHTMGNAVILQGDARNLEGVMADCVMFSPPYADQDSFSRRQGKGFQYTGHHRTSEGHCVLKPKITGETEGQIGNLKYGNLADVIISSPPYTNRMDGGMKDAPGMLYTNEAKDSWYTTRDQQNIGNLPYGSVDAVITSPPYEEAMGEKHHSPRADKLAKEKANPVTYTDKPDCIITSPPYEGSLSTQDDVDKRKLRLEKQGLDSGTGHFTGQIRRMTGGENVGAGSQGYSDTSSNIGNLKGESYLSAMLQVYQQCHVVLKDGGLMCLVTKNFIRDKKIVNLDTDTVRLCEQAGFEFIERHYRKLTQQSFWRTIYKQKYPDAPEIDHEDILVFRKAESLSLLEVR